VYATLGITAVSGVEWQCSTNARRFVGGQTRKIDMKIGFIGGGVMAEAIIAGIVDSGLDAQVTVGEPVAVRREALSKLKGVTVTGNNAEAISGANIVAIAVKPQQFEAVAASLSSLLKPEQTVLSIMAGVKMHSIGLKLNHKRLIRVMPNTPMQVRQGISAWTVTADVPQDVIDFTGSMLRSLGDELKFSDERYVDIATALSASGPAYVFMFIESLADAGVKLGLPSHVARHLAYQTVLGSAALAKETKKHPAELRNMVTSPGGTTAAGLHALEEGAFRAVVTNAVEAAFRRGEELAEGK
jgi:pyrroline-5-carboxylate reductase